MNSQGSSFAPDLLQALINISGAFPALYLLLQAVFGLIGLYLFGQALLDIYSLNNPNAHRTGKSLSAAGISARIIVSVVLTSLIWFVDVTQNTLSGGDASSGSMMYATAGLSTGQKLAIAAIFGVFSIAGYVAFGRGWLLLDKHFNGGNTGVWGAFWHIVGGTALVYLDYWLPSVGQWFGFDFSNILLF